METIALQAAQEAASHVAHEAAIRAVYGADPEAAILEVATAALEAASTALEAVEIFQALALDLEGQCNLPRLYGGEVAPDRHEGADFVWARVDTRGTGNGGRYVATRPLSPRAKELRAVLMAALARLLPGFHLPALLWAGGLFWEPATLEWLGSLSPAEARLLAGKIPTSHREVAELRRQGFHLPQCSIPRTVAAIKMAAAAAR